MKKRSAEKPDLRHRLSDFRLDQRGSALLLAIILSVVGALLMFAGARMVRQSQKETLAENREMIEADNAARAGISDALAWFRRQPTGSVAQNGSTFIYNDGPFYPRQTPTTVAGQVIPADTMDESLGLMKEYQISSSTMSGVPKWMRYEVRRQQLTAPLALTPAIPAGTPTFAIDPYAAHDVSGERLPSNSDNRGFVWQLTSVGYVFTRPVLASGVATPVYNQSPCQVLASSAIQSEFRQLAINLPTIGGKGAALYIDTPFSNVTLNGVSSGSVQLLGGGDGNPLNNAYGIISTVGGGSPSVTNARLYGVQGNTATAGTTLLYTTVFGYGLPDLKNMADSSVGDPSELYSNGVTQLPSLKLYVIDPPSGSATFGSSVTFGTSDSVMIVDGNLTISSVYNSFSGVLYVHGNLIINPPGGISGVVIVSGGTVKMNPAGGTDGCIMSYSADVLSTTKQQVAQYRENQGAVRRYTDWLYR